MENRKNLTNTQTRFIKYIEDEIKKNNRIISINTDGHFGFDYAVESICKKNKIFIFEELINMTGEPWYFKIIHFLLSIVMIFTYVITIAKIKINISLKMDTLLKKIKHTNSYKYLLSYTWKNSKKFKKINKIVILKNIDGLTTYQYQKLEMLKSSIENKKIRKAMLIINNQQTESNNLINSFYLTRSDGEILLKNHNIYNIEIDEDYIKLIKKCGIEICINIFLKLQKVHINCNFKNIGDVLDAIFINVPNLDVEEINCLLSYVSIYDKYFSRKDVANIDTVEFECQDIDSAKDLTILKEKQNNMASPKYCFSKKAFQEYYFDLYRKYLKPHPNVVYTYVLSKPFEYNSILKLYKIDEEICKWNEINSFIIKAYFYSVFLGSEEQKKQVLMFLTNENRFIANEYIFAYENFINNKKICFDDEYDIINTSVFDSISACMILCMLLQISKERWKDEKRSKKYCTELLKHITLNEKDIQNQNNNLREELLLEKRYWNLYFKELFIAYALEINDIKEKSLLTFRNDIYKFKKDILLNNFIKKYSLRELNRIELLGSNINEFNETENILKNVALNSKNDKISQLALINLSVFYIEKCEFNNAILQLIDVENIYHGLINSDTKLSIGNNKIVALFLNSKIDKNEAVNTLKKQFEIDNVDSADVDIIRNNIIAIEILKYKKDVNILNDKILELENIIQQSNEFSKFYAINNLLYIYYLCNKKEEFTKYFNNIRKYIPKLLFKYTDFFIKKFEYIYDHWENKKLEIIDININAQMPPMYRRLLMFGGIERWFE